MQIAMGQNIEFKGLVIDSISRAGIEFANVLLFYPDSSFCDGAITDSKGAFHFFIKHNLSSNSRLLDAQVANSSNNQPVSSSIAQGTTSSITHSAGQMVNQSITTNRSYFIKVSCLGYQNKYCSVGVGQLLQIELGQNPILLNEVKITGKLNRVKNNTSNMVFKVTDLIRENAFLATHILEQIPTLYVDFNNNIFVRGRGNVLITHNGMELADKALVNQIAPQSIERVEVSRTVPTKYLAKGYSAIVNIVTKRSENMNLKVHGNASPNKLYDADLNFKVDKGRHSVYTFYKLYYRNFIEDLMVNDSFNDPKSYPISNLIANPKTSTINNLINDHMTNPINSHALGIDPISNHSVNRLFTNIHSSFFLKVKPRIEFDNEFFYGYAYAPTAKTTIGIDGYLSLYHEHFRTKQKMSENFIDLSDAKTDFRSHNYVAYLQHKDSLNTLNARLNFTYKKVDGEIYYSPHIEDYNRENNYRLSSEVDYSRRISRTLKLNAGVDYSYVNNWSSFSYSAEKNHSVEKEHYRFIENCLTAYCDANIDLKSLSLLFGANIFTQNKNFQAKNLQVKSTYFFPKFSGLYTFDSNNSLMLGFYSTQNQPTIWQLMANPIRVTSTYIKQGNPYLKPENTARLALEYNYTKGATYCSVVLFGERVKNKIADQYTLLDNQQLLSRKINLKKSGNCGLSLSFNYDLFDWWSIRSGADFFVNFIPENVYFKKHQASMNANITNVLSYRKYMLAFRYAYNGKELAYNGYFKPYNSSLAQLRYKFNSKLTLSLIWTQPIGSFKSESMVHYNQHGAYANRISQIHTRSALFSFVYNIFNKSTTSNREIYNNVDRKY